MNPATWQLGLGERVIEEPHEIFGPWGCDIIPHPPILNSVVCCLNFGNRSVWFLRLCSQLGLG